VFLQYVLKVKILYYVAAMNAEYELGDATEITQYIYTYAKLA
jgi:hypothetical protein